VPVYPPGHILEGRPIGPVTMAQLNGGYSPRPPPGGAPLPPATYSPAHGPASLPGSGWYSPSHSGGSLHYAPPPPQQYSPHHGAEPLPARTRSIYEGRTEPQQQQAAQPQPYFEPIMVMEDLSQIAMAYPRMPNALSSRDVSHDDWIKFIVDLGDVWQKSGMLDTAQRGSITPSVHLVDGWNYSFFLFRGVEVILYKGGERLNGAQAGKIDQLAHVDYSDSEDSSESSDNDAYAVDELAKLYGYGTGDAHYLERAREAQVSRKQARRNRKREKREKRRQRKKQFSLYLVCSTPPNPGPR